MNTLVYQARTSVQWGYLPHDLTPKSTAYDDFARWRDDGTWQIVVDALREAGYGGGEKVKGRNRPYVFDTRGFLLAVAATAANCDDGTHAPEGLRKLSETGHPRVRVAYAGSKYNHSLDRWMSDSGAHDVLHVVTEPAGGQGSCPSRSGGWPSKGPPV